ncbi:hypothetical protein F4860DRAFT_311512 [Xylaria cubensis]|nr:hypothetical protein F4860DRAFT_311512 [Xylaria cubensis]
MDGLGDRSVEDGISNSSSLLANMLPGLNAIEGMTKELQAEKTKAEKTAQEWEKKYRETEEKLEKLEKEYEKQASQNWALDNRVQDQSREIQRLELALQNSIPLTDWEHPPPKMRTALELAQQDRIKELEWEMGRFRQEAERLEKEKRD